MERQLDDPISRAAAQHLSSVSQELVFQFRGATLARLDDELCRYRDLLEGRWS